MVFEAYECEDVLWSKYEALKIPSTTALSLEMQMSPGGLPKHFTSQVQDPGRFVMNGATSYSLRIDAVRRVDLSLS